MFTKDVSGTTDESGSVRLWVGLFGKGTLAPVDPAISAEIRAMEIIGTPRQRLAVMPDLTLIANAVVIGIGEFPDDWRC